MFDIDLLKSKRVKKKNVLVEKNKKTSYLIEIQRLAICLVPRAGVLAISNGFQLFRIYSLLSAL